MRKVYTIIYKVDGRWQLHTVTENKQEFVDNLIILSDWEYPIKTKIEFKTAKISTAVMADYYSEETDEFGNLLPIQSWRAQ